MDCESSQGLRRHGESSGSDERGREELVVRGCQKEIGFATSGLDGLLMNAFDLVQRLRCDLQLQRKGKTQEIDTEV